MITDALIARCLREEPKAQYELYRALHPVMMSICTRYQRDRQEAVAMMNQGFLRILQGLGTRSAGVPFEPWARRVVINTVIDTYRREKERRMREAEDLDGHEADSPVINEYLERMEAEAFARMVSALPAMSRAVFNLFAVDGYGHGEIALMLGISEGTSKWHVSQARTLLKRAIARDAMILRPKTTTR